MDWPENILYGPTDLDNSVFKNLQNIQQNHKLHHENHRKLKGWIWLILGDLKIQSGIFLRDSFLSLLFIITMIQLSKKMDREGAKLAKSQENIHHLYSP